MNEDGCDYMTLPKLLAVVSILLFGVIGIAAVLKKQAASSSDSLRSTPLEVELDGEVEALAPAIAKSDRPLTREGRSLESLVPEVDRVGEFFNTNDPKLPIVETLTYKSHVPWQKGRPAWLSDYAAHYQTSRHFIARSLNGKPDYFKQDLAEGDRFNVLRQDKNFEFHLVIDTSRCRMWFYYKDVDENKRILLKDYPVGLGRPDSSKASGLLTPLGTYKLGDRVAIYKPKMMGIRHGDKIEMMTVFGSRWIPFEKEIGCCTAPAKGLGIHGTPWVREVDGGLVDYMAGIGKYESDGCIRMATPDLEELFAIIITRPAVVEIVRDVLDSSLSNKE